MRLPDYSHSSLSVTASLFGYFGGHTDYPRLPQIDHMLSKGGIDNILLILADGMGENLLRRHLPEGAFLRRHDKAALSSVYPSTTAAAATSLWTGLSPISHGWLGWSLYFKKCARQIDTFTGAESYLGDRYPSGSPAPLLMPLPELPSGMEDVETHLIFPSDSCALHLARYPHVIQPFGDALSLAAQLVRRPGKHLIGLYTPQPDHTLHEKGVNAPESRACFARINREIELFSASLPANTLLVVTADHGLVDSTVPVYLSDIPSIDQCLWMPPAIEPRCSALYVKPFRRAQFEREFRAACGEDFVLFSREAFLENGLFGPGAPHPMAEDFLGDYIACAVGERHLRYHTLSCKKTDMIGRHAGLTEDEMTVPLILYRGQ